MGVLARLQAAPITFSGGLKTDESGLHAFIFMRRTGRGKQTTLQQLFFQFMHISFDLSGFDDSGAIQKPMFPEMFPPTSKSWRTDVALGLRAMTMMSSSWSSEMQRMMVWLRIRVRVGQGLVF